MILVSYSMYLESINYVSLNNLYLGSLVDARSIIHSNIYIMKEYNIFKYKSGKVLEIGVEPEFRHNLVLSRMVQFTKFAHLIP